MATYSVSSTGEYLSTSRIGTNEDNFVITDNDGGSVFENGELIFRNGIAIGNFGGTININGQICIVVFSFSGTNLVFSPVPSASFGGFPPSINLATVNPGDFTVCFAAGTMIATPDGECAVETLAIGDMVLTANGKSVPVKWVGRQTVSKTFTPSERFVPVRVKAGALGGGLPKRDLVLTADHALVIDGLLVNAGAIVNGTSIAWEPFDTLPESVTYYHVETEAQDIILAEGAPAETFVDHVTRRRFDNFAEYEALYGDEATIPSLEMPRVSAARLVPQQLRERLGIRAAA
mgnify:FL=1